MELFNKVTAGRLALPEKVRVNLLALGDVGSTLLLGLRLMGGDVISSMGICDVRENAALRWEFELNQIQPPSGAALPPVEIISPEQLFDGDVFLFCASRMVPDTSVTVQYPQEIIQPRSSRPSFDRLQSSARGTPVTPAFSCNFRDAVSSMVSSLQQNPPGSASFPSSGHSFRLTSSTERVAVESLR